MKSYAPTGEAIERSIVILASRFNNTFSGFPKSSADPRIKARILNRPCQKLCDVMLRGPCSSISSRFYLGWSPWLQAVGGGV